MHKIAVSQYPFIALSKESSIFQPLRVQACKKLRPVNDDLIQTFKGLGKVRSLSHKYVFTRNGRHIKHIREVFDQVKEDSGVQDLWFHDLRGTAVTNMLDATGDQKTVMAITGHKTTSVFRRYIKVTDDRLKAAADAAHQRLKAR